VGRVLMTVAVLCWLGGGCQEDELKLRTIQVEGRVEKGPFVMGASLVAWPMSRNGAFLSAPVERQVENDLGGYQLFCRRAILFSGRA